MVQRITRPVYRHIFDYFAHFREFSHNTRTYLLAIVLQTMGGSMVGTVFVLHLKASGIRESNLGYIEGAIGIGTAIIALLGPPLVASLGYRALMLGALALLAGARFAQGLMPLATVLIGLGFVFGLGDGLLRAINSAFLSENSHKHQRAHVFSVEFLGRMLAVFAGAIAGGFLPLLVGGPVGTGYGWTIFIGSLLMAAGTIPLARVREKIPGVRGFWRVSIEQTKQFDAWGHLLTLVTPQAFLVAAGAMTAPFIPLYLNKTLGASVQQIGLIQGLGALIVGLAAFSTPWITRRFGAARGVTYLQIAALPLIFAVPYVGGLLVGVLMLFVRSTLMGVGGPLYNELAMEGLSAAEKPLVAGGMTFVLSAMGVLGNIAGGQLMEHSYTAPYAPAAVLYAIGTGLTYLMWVRRPSLAANTAHLRHEGFAEAA